MTNIKNVKALMHTFYTGDTDKAYELLADGYIQHNLKYASGKEAFLRAVEFLKSIPEKTTVTTIRAFEDGDKVILHNVFHSPQVGIEVTFDIFRIDTSGKIAEHWDNLTLLGSSDPNRIPQVEGTTDISDVDKTAENKKIVEEFIVDILHNNHTNHLTRYIEGESYITHGSLLPSVNPRTQYEKTHMILGQGNFVLAVSEGSIDGIATSFYNLFCLKNGKIIEHWDVIETITDKSTWIHQNGKF